MAFLPKACSNGRALLLDYRPLVGYCLCGSHIPDELLHCARLSIYASSFQLGFAMLGIQEVIAVASRTPPGQQSGGQIAGGIRMLYKGLAQRPGEKKIVGRAVGAGLVLSMRADISR